MDKTSKSYLLKFEVLSESKSGNLVNGFSAAIGMSDASALGGMMPNLGCTNNCEGGNCVKGCGGGGGSNGAIMCTLP